MKTVVLGATPNPARYAWLAVVRLTKYGHEVVPIGIKKGNIEGLEIINDRPQIADVHTVTLYLNPLNQVGWYDYIISLKPKRIIFNPGTENPDLENLVHKHDIQTIEACTLVMLSTGVYETEMT